MASKTSSGDLSPSYRDYWRCEDGTCIKYEELNDKHLEAIATGLFLNNRVFGLHSSIMLQVTKFKIAEEIYRRLIKKMIVENKLESEQALLMTSKFDFLRSLFK